MYYFYLMNTFELVVSCGIAVLSLDVDESTQQRWFFFVRWRDM